MSADLSSVKQKQEGSELHKEILGAIETSSSGSPTVREDHHVGIERAFDVVRNHTVHTKGYVITALKFIEEFGSRDDKVLLKDLLKVKESPRPSQKSSVGTPKKRSKRS